MSSFLHPQHAAKNKLSAAISLVLMLMSCLFAGDSHGQQSNLDANPNTYIPLVSSTAANFTNSSSQTLGADHFTPLGNLTNTNTGDAATWTSLVVVGSVQRWVQVQDNRATSGQEYKAGTYAGFVFTSATLLGIASTTTVTVQTYLNGSPVGTSSGAISIAQLVKVAGANQAKLGYISTADFNGIRITFDISGIGVAPSVSVNYAEVAKFVAGPTLVCNTKTSMNLPTYPMSVSSSVTGAITLLGGISNLDAVISSSTSDFATVDPSLGVLGDSITVGVKDNVTDYAYPTFVGFDIESSSLVNLSVAGSIVIKTYANGVLTGRATGNSLLVGASVLTGSNRQVIGFVPNGAVDSVCLTLKSGAIAGVTLASTNIYRAVFRRFCEGTVLSCNTLTALDESNYPIYINAQRTGVTGGVLGVNNNIQDASNVIDNNASTYATAKVLAGAVNEVSLSVKKELANFDDSTFAGFEISNTSTLLTVDVLDDITITTYLDGVQREEKTGQAALASVASSLLGGGSNRMVVGFFTTMEYDEVVITFNNVVAANTGEYRIYSFYEERFCTGTINCNGTYWLNSGPPPTGYPVIINGQRTGTNGLACVTVTGVQLSNSGNVITPSTTDYATIKPGVDVACPVAISVQDVLTTYPSGTIAGYAIQNIGSLIELGLLNYITISTWNNGSFRESASGANLLNLELLNSPLLGTGNGKYNVGFKTTMTFDEIRISIGNLANVDPLSEVHVFGAFVDTRNVTSSDGTQSLTCLVPSIAPAGPATVCSGSSLLLTATPAGATTYTWYKDSAVINGATSQTYSANASGSYTVTVNATGYSGVMSNAVVITVINCSPIAEPDNNATPQGHAVNGDLSINDSDPRNLALTYNTTPVQNPAHGTATINADGTYTYTPAPTYAGIDSFTYQVCNSASYCTTQKAYISVVATTMGNDAPIAADDYPATKVNTPISSTVASNDIDPEKDPLTFSLTGTAQNGSISMNPNGTFTYTPNTGFTGTEAIPYQVCDNGSPSLCDNAVLYITITPNDNGPANDPPIAVNDVNNTQPGVTVTGNVGNNDTDPNGNTLSFSLIGPTPTGLVFNANGSYSYTPAINFVGTMNVSYSVCDNGSPSLCDTATLSIVSSATLVPDLTPTITVAPNIMNGITNFYMTVQVTEINNVNTSGTITVLIPKDSRVSFTYQPSLTTVGATPVNNSNWSYDGSNAFYHVFTSTNVINGNSFSTFGVVASFNPMNAKGNYTLTSSIVSGSGGETKTTNNSDAEIINYFPGN